MMLEKSYTRLTSLPSAADVRPLPVLRDAFELVTRRWAESTCDYAYACDMLKSIRQDLTVQHLAADGARSDFARLVYEWHARIALQSDDLGEFGACLAALAPIHAAAAATAAATQTAAAVAPTSATDGADVIAEFAAYRVLHASLLRLDSLGSELRGILDALTPRARSHPMVVQALQLAKALAADDPVRVLSALRGVRHLGVRLFSSRLPRLRERALHVICKAYAPSVPRGFLARMLGFGDDARGARECEGWLRSIGCGLVRATSGRAGAPSAEEEEKEQELELVLETRAALRTLSQLDEERRRAASAEEAEAQASRRREAARIGAAASCWPGGGDAVLGSW